MNRQAGKTSDLERLEEALRESEVLRYGILDNDPNPIVVHNPDLSIKFVNRALEEFTGFTSEELVGQYPPYSWWAAETALKSKEDLQTRMRRPKSHVEEIFQSRDGRKIFVEVNSRPVKHKGKTRYLLASWVDVTERVLSARALEESERFSSSLLKYSPNPILVFNADGSIKYVNPALERLTKFSSAELVGIKPPYPWWIEENIEKETGEFLSLLHHRGRKTEKLIRNKAGEQIWIQITSAPIIRDRKFVFGLSNWVDITERKKAEAQLKRLTKELRVLSAHSESVREKERSRISREVHDELGQALASLKMDVRWLDDNLGENVEYCHELTGSMAKLIDLTVQRVKSICFELRPKLLDDIGLAGTIEWFLTQFQATTGIKCDFSSHLKDKGLDDEKATTVFRIFQETLTNIYRHAHATRVAVKLDKTQYMLVLKIQDNGKGITEEQITSPKSLGLMGIRERVFYCGGTIDISGSQGKGTRLLIKIPLGAKESTDV
jgi:PAS domain S-box-containing protein